jgi:hypothetical protein
MEANMMTSLVARAARIGFASLAMTITILMTGVSGAAANTHGRHIRHLHARSVLFESRAQLLAPTPVRLGAMRYYGGPKSPMWRGPAEN